MFQVSEDLLYNLGVWRVVSPYLTNKAECIWFVWISFSSLFLRRLKQATPFFCTSGLFCVTSLFHKCSRISLNVSFCFRKHNKNGKESLYSFGCETKNPNVSWYADWFFPNIQHMPSQVVEVISYTTPYCTKWSFWGQRKMAYCKSRCLFMFTCL